MSFFSALSVRRIIYCRWAPPATQPKRSPSLARVSSCTGSASGAGKKFHRRVCSSFFYETIEWTDSRHTAHSGITQKFPSRDRKKKMSIHKTFYINCHLNATKADIGAYTMYSQRKITIYIYYQGYLCIVLLLIYTYIVCIQNMAAFF